MINRGMGNMSFLRRALNPEIVAKNSTQGNTETNKGFSSYNKQKYGGPLL